MNKILLSKLLSALFILSFTHSPAQSAGQKNQGHPFFISNTRMNVLYIGVTNLIQVIVPGIDDKDIMVTLSGDGVLGRDTFPHFYYALVNSPGVCEIKVAAKTNGKITELGSQEFRAKYVPDAIAMTTGNLEGGAVSADKMKTQFGLMCMLKNFDFDYHLSITSYTMTFITGGKILKAQATGAAFSPQMKTYLSEAKAGDAIFFEDITVTGPANKSRKLNTVAFYLQ